MGIFDFPFGQPIPAVTPPPAGVHVDSPPAAMNVVPRPLGIKPTLSLSQSLAGGANATPDTAKELQVRGATAVKVAGFLNGNLPVDGIIWFELSPGVYHLVRDGDVFHFQPFNNPRIYWPAQAGVVVWLSFWTDSYADPMEMQRP